MTNIPTPLGLPAIVLVLLYCIVAAVSGAGYYNWPPFSSLLYGSGAYAWLCDGGVVTDPPPVPACESQQVSLVSMYSLGFVVSQLSGLVSGAILDIQGPRLTAMLGLIAGCLGWLGLSISNEGRRFHQLSMLFIGVSASLNGLPGNWVSVLFPRRSSLVLSLISASFDASLAVPLVLLKIKTYYVKETPFKDLMRAYALLVLAPACFISFFIFPNQTPTIQKEGGQKKGGRRRSSILLHGVLIEHAVDRSEMGGQSTPDLHSNNNSTPDLRSDRTGADPRHICRRRTLLKHSFWKQVWSMELWCFLVYFVFSSLRNTFFCLAAERLGGPKLGQLIGLLSPLACLPCYGFGIVVDAIGVLKTAQWINTAGFLMFLTVVVWQLTIPYEGFLVFAAILYVLSSSFTYGQMIVYVSETFGLKYFGTLIGAAGICDGITALTNAPIYYLALKIPNGFVKVAVLFAVASVLNFAPVILIQRRIGWLKEDTVKGDLDNYVALF